MGSAYERVASDPGLRRLLEVARSWGVAPSVFAGRELSTRHDHDAAGRSVLSVTGGWTEEDRELAVALADWEADLCGGCGHPLAETTAPGNEERYEVRVAARCHCCTAIDIAEKALQTRDHPTALLLSAVLRSDDPPNQGANDADPLPA
jgi:hypothetical protein